MKHAAELTGGRGWGGLTCFGTGAVLTETTIGSTSVQFSAAYSTLFRTSVWIQSGRDVLAEPEGGGAPARCHSVASAASLLMYGSSTLIRMFSGLMSVWMI